MRSVFIGLSLVSAFLGFSYFGTPQCFSEGEWSTACPMLLISKALSSIIIVGALLRRRFLIFSSVGLEEGISEAVRYQHLLSLTLATAYVIRQGQSFSTYGDNFIIFLDVFWRKRGYLFTVIYAALIFVFASGFLGEYVWIGAISIAITLNFSSHLTKIMQVNFANSEPEFEFAVLWQYLIANTARVFTTWVEVNDPLTLAYYGALVLLYSFMFLLAFVLLLTKEEGKGLSYTPRAFVGHPAPQFESPALSENGRFTTIKLTSYLGRYVVLFFYPNDSTLVCLTEILKFSDLAPQFRKLEAEVIGASIDSKFSHLEYTQKPREAGGLGKLNIPLLADVSKQVSKDYGAYIDHGENAGVALRVTYIIDRKGILRHISINDLTVGRNVQEVLRLVKAFQYSDVYGEVCPESWIPDADTLEADP